MSVVDEFANSSDAAWELDDNDIGVFSTNMLTYPHIYIAIDHTGRHVLLNKNMIRAKVEFPRLVIDDDGDTAELLERLSAHSSTNGSDKTEDEVANEDAE